MNNGRRPSKMRVLKQRPSSHSKTTKIPPRANNNVPNFRFSRPQYSSLRKEEYKKNTSQFYELGKYLRNTESGGKCLNCSQYYDRKSSLTNSVDASRKKFSSIAKRSNSVYKAGNSSFTAGYQHPLGSRILSKADTILEKGKKYSSEYYSQNKRVSSIKITSKNERQKISFTSLLKKHQQTRETWKRKLHRVQDLDQSFKDLDQVDPDEVEREVPVKIDTQEVRGISEEAPAKLNKSVEESRIKIFNGEPKSKEKKALPAPLSILKPVIQQVNICKSDELKRQKEEAEKCHKRDEMMKEVNDIIGELQSILHPKTSNTYHESISELPEFLSLYSESPAKRPVLGDCKKNLCNEEFLSNNESINSGKENFYDEDLQDMESFHKEIEAKIANNTSNIYCDKGLSEYNNCDSPKTQKEEKRVLIDMTNQQ
ncbi:unnamed protein product [Moneuplotes crassus]|uniref:Uncharacterized protein n=1 Tax=Euplotes crassus TaxID=5936 RepID=A0AAD1UI68_EUPCR|nr:unnamed protein product [Moneuplotes crassus]